MSQINSQNGKGNAMKEIKAIANAHLRRDMQTGKKWTCECEPCREMRSLVGVDKLLDVRPLVRELGNIETQLEGMPDGDEKRSLMEKYFALHDELAEVMAK
jgi:hypothetical protein